MLGRAGLEIFFIGAEAGGSSAAPSVFFAFGSELERDDVAALIAEQASVGAHLPGGRTTASACGSILEVQGLPFSAALVKRFKPFHVFHIF